MIDDKLGGDVLNGLYSIVCENSWYFINRKGNYLGF